MSKALAGFVVLLGTLMLLLTPAQPVDAVLAPVSSHPSGAFPALAPVVGQGTQAVAGYDEQLGMTFPNDFSQLAYNVTALAQSDSNGFGPGYILNGLTEAGYWYQVGIAYDWPYKTGGYDAGFHFLYEVFNSTGASIYPTVGGGGLLNLTGTVVGGDNVLLKLDLSAGRVSFSVYDWNTGANASTTYEARGSRFVGLEASSNTNGFFTGLMTEWYHADPYYGSEEEVTYTSSVTRLASAVLWADESKVNDTVPLFSDAQSFTFSNPTLLVSLSTNGATEHANANTFITGSTPQGSTTVTLSYSVSGGGTNYAPPLLNYTFDGVQHTTTLAVTPTTYSIDPGSTWQVSSSLPGGTPTERWETNEQTTGTSGEETDFVYWHQFLSFFGYSIRGGGIGYSPPAVRATEYGSSVQLNANTSAWTDAGTAFSFESLLQGSTTSERWALLNYSGTTTGPQDIVVPYFHQSGLTLAYNVTGGGSPNPPTLSGTQFGTTFTTVIANMTTYFLDQGTGWSVQDLLPGSGPTERWFASQDTNGTVSGPATLGLIYYHQYAVSVVATPLEGGSTLVSAAWANSGAEVSISEVTGPGWQFEGWSGSGSGSYSGSLGSILVPVLGPLEENATFYPGLVISAGANGQVSFSSPGMNGSVPPGEVRTIFLSQGSGVTLDALPASVFYVFSGWRGLASGAGSRFSLALNSPETVVASFSISPLVVAGAILALAAVVSAVVVGARRRSQRAPLRV